MTTGQSNRETDAPKGGGLPLPRYPRFINQYMAVDNFFVRLLGFPLVSWGAMSCNGCKTVPALILITKGR